MSDLEQVLASAENLAQRLEAQVAQELAMQQTLPLRFEANMAADSVTGTPTVIIDGVKVENWAWDNLKSLLDAKLAG